MSDITIFTIRISHTAKNRPSTLQPGAYHVVTAGRISQLRQLLEAPWAEFQEQRAAATRKIGDWRRHLDCGRRLFSHQRSHCVRSYSAT